MKVNASFSRSVAGKLIVIAVPTPVVASPIVPRKGGSLTGSATAVTLNGCCALPSLAVVPVTSMLLTPVKPFGAEIRSTAS